MCIYCNSNSIQIYGKSILINKIRDKTGPKIPKDMEQVEYSCCDNLETLFPKDQEKELLDYIMELTCMSCPKVVITYFPNNLTSLTLTHLDFKFLPKLPATLKILDLRHCEKLKMLCSYKESLPASLTYLSCDDSEKLHYIGEILPASLEILSLRYSRIRKLVLPSSLKDLNCSSARIKELKLPASLVGLECRGCYRLKELDCSNTKLIKLDCCFSRNIYFLRNIPKTLKELDCSCAKITELNYIPEKIEYYGCKYLSLNKELYENSLKQVKFLQKLARKKIRASKGLPSGSRSSF